MELNLARPPVNALNAMMLEELTAAISSATDEGAQALFLSGRPGLFSAGIDVRELLAEDRAGVAGYWSTFFTTLRTIASCPAPIGAAITGQCPAGGTVLALFCDYRVMADGEFSVGLNEVRVGLPLPEVILAALCRQVGPRNAEHLAVGGRMLSPQRALQIGLLDRVVPLADVLSETLEWARELIGLPPRAMRETRANARADLIALFDGIGPDDAERMAERWMSDETQQTMRAVIEKRPAKP
ncbi:MAG: enoyl-CoA hydratase/isomerase family protein [Gammaproteobacteria bacterium]